ncbi:MAG TPA: filamentous hemagglutinin N-terminal domain-containing protein [Allocoleopsis sp.]
MMDKVFISPSKLPEVYREKKFRLLGVRSRRGWQLGIVRNLGLVGTITLTGCFAIASSGNLALAQVASDNTLGTNVKSPTPRNFLINGGTTRGANLFHSFREFSIPTGGSVYFNNASNIQNIITRVTGLSVSNIDGLIGANGTANLFLLNPNGIIFGQNASLNIGGSFVATTASAIQFGNQGVFSATTPNVPSLLTVNPSALLFNQIKPNAIANTSIAPAGLSPSGTDVTGLRVPDGKSLLLVGGDVQLSTGGSLNAVGGRIELGGLAAPGTVGLQVNGNILSLNFAPNSRLSNVNLANDTRVSVRGEGGGDIFVNANTFSATNGGRLLAGTEGIGNAGNITVNASTVNISGVASNGVGSGLYNPALNKASGNAGNIFVNTDSFFLSNGALLVSGNLGQGDSGNINITAGSFTMSNGAQLIASTFGQGNAGSVSVQAQGSVSLANSAIFSNVGNSQGVKAVGNVGKILIEADSVSLTDGAQLQAGIYSGSQGNSGIISLKATDFVSLAGTGTAIYGNVESGAVGNGSDIQISAHSVTLTDGAQLYTSNAGQGNAGNVSVQAIDLLSFVGNDTAIVSEAGPVGNSGNINITAGSFKMSNGAQLDASTFGQGNAGNISVQVRDSISLRDHHTDIGSNVATGAVGKGGNIDIHAGSLELSDGAQVQASILDASQTSSGGLGNAGNIAIDVRGTVTLRGDGTIIYSDVGAGAVGNGGNIDIKAESLSLTDGTGLYSATNGQGNAGNVSVQVVDSVSLTNNANIFTSVGADAVGKGGNIDIQAASLSLANASVISSENFGGRGDRGKINIQVGSLFMENATSISTSTFGQGNGGGISIGANDLISLTNGSLIFSSVLTQGVGNGGDITLKTGSLSLTNGSQVSASVIGQGIGGNLTIEARDTISLSGVSNKGGSNGISSYLDSGAIGKGGNINIQAGAFSLGNGLVSTSTLGQGNGGNIDIKVGSLSLKDTAVTSESQGTGKAGDITIQTRENLESDRSQISAFTLSGDGGNITLGVGNILLLRHDGSISTSGGVAQTVGNGGNITINTPFIVAIPQENSDITADAYTGNGGKVTVNTQYIFGTQFRERLTPESDITASSEFGQQGVVAINSVGIDPSRGLVNLSTEPVDISRQIAQNCRTQKTARKDSRFVIIGRGGLPPSPNDPLSGESVITNWVTLDSHSEPTKTQAAATPSSSVPRQMLEAQGWTVNEQGKVVLTATAPTVTPNSEWFDPTQCNVPQN